MTPKPWKIRLIMNSYLGFTWKRPEVRPPHSNREDVLENRRIFKAFMQGCFDKGARFVFIDESSFSPRNMKFKTWQSKRKPVPVVRPYSTVSIAMISAVTDNGLLLSQL